MQGYKCLRKKGVMGSDKTCGLEWHIKAPPPFKNIGHKCPSCDWPYVEWITYEEYKKCRC